MQPGSPRAAFALFIAAALSASAQPSRAMQLQSPVVHPDGKVTFSVRAPNARKVELGGQFQKGDQPLTRDTNGVWSITAGPIGPNMSTGGDAAVVFQVGLGHY